jgi:farnesyl-diphosphate farnesyltransferase
MADELESGQVAKSGEPDDREPGEGDISRAVITAEERRTLEALLEETSRTFALAIPLLPEPTRLEVTVAYLLFRVADTFEDATQFWPATQRAEALQQFAELVRSGDRSALAQAQGSWLGEPPSDHSGYLRLLRRADLVVRALDYLSPEARRVVAHHTGRTAVGMAAFVARSGEEGEVRLRDEEDLWAYCYVVAGIVGELLTDLFLLERAYPQAVAARLRSRAVAFGEGLQLVNILRDSAGDAGEGRHFLPDGISPETTFARAREDLVRAREYVLVLQEGQAPAGVVSFCASPVALAFATLDAVEKEGPGAKLSRVQVFHLHRRVLAAVKKGLPPVALPPQR